MSLTYYPYRDYALPLVIGGIVLLITGYFTGEPAGEEIEVVDNQQSMSGTNFCPNCGTKKDFDARYCKKCGKKFE